MYLAEESIKLELTTFEQNIDAKDAKSVRERSSTITPQLLRALTFAQKSLENSSDAIFVAKMKEQTDKLRTGALLDTCARKGGLILSSASCF